MVVVDLEKVEIILGGTLSARLIARLLLGLSQFDIS